MSYKIENLNVGSLDASRTNPRKRFDSEKLRELADSIEVQGVLTPLLVRAAGERYEIVAGERRWRAAQLAGLDVVPCLVREMDDAAVLEAQLVENLQRDDLEPMEEARGFFAMMEMRGEDGKPVYTAEGVAGVIGKSVHLVYRRLKLMRLPDDGQAAVDAGRLDASVGEMIGRIPDARLRARALTEVLRPKGYDRPLTARETRALIELRYMRTLNGCSFDTEDASLHPSGVVCSTCVHRAGNNPDMEGVHGNMCLDPVCFQKKTDVAYARWKAAHVSDGQRALTVAENKKHMEGDRLVAWSSDLVALNEAPAAHLLNAVAQGKALATWRTLIEGRGVEVVVARKSDDSALECVDRELAMAAARLNGYEIFRPSNKEERAAYEAERKELAAEAKHRRQLNVRIVEAVQDKEVGDAEVWLREFCVAVLMHSSEGALLMAARKISSERKLVAEVQGLGGAALLVFAAQIVMAEFGFDGDAQITPTGTRLLKQIGVDVRKVEKGMRGKGGGQK